MAQDRQTEFVVKSLSEANPPKKKLEFSSGSVFALVRCEKSYLRGPLGNSSFFLGGWLVVSSGRSDIKSIVYGKSAESKQLVGTSWA